jgi:hypothetical protein
MDDKKDKIETYDPVRRVGILSGQRPNETKLGPMRRAPEYYAGETYGRHIIHYRDVERYGNGVLPSKRDKHARRIIRKALKRKYSAFEQAVKLPRAMLAQAKEIAKSEKKSVRWAHRLFAKELNIHQPVYAPDGKTLRKMRTEARRLKRRGGKDAISQLVDAMADRQKR